MAFPASSKAGGFTGYHVTSLGILHKSNFPETQFFEVAEVRKGKAGQQSWPSWRENNIYIEFNLRSRAITRAFLNDGSPPNPHISIN